MKRRSRYLTTGEVAKACEVSLVTVKKWIRQRKLKAFRTPGGHFRVTAKEFQRLQVAYGFVREPEDSPRILVVDDDPGLLEVLLNVLRDARPGLKLEAASDGYEGLLKVGTFRPHLLVLDLRMPGMDGFEVCRRIKSDPVLRTAKILAITGYPEDFARERAFESGADAFLTKPFTLTELKAEVKRLMARARA